MTAILSPIGGAAAQFFNNQGVILAGGQIFTYVAGSITTAQATYTDSTQGTQNPNPVVLDSTGRPPNEIWLASNAAYKFVLKDSNNNTIGSWDNIQGIGSGGSSTQTEWINNGLAVTYVSANQFSVPGNFTSLFTANRRIQYGLASGTFYGWVVGSVYDGASTTVTIGSDTTNLNNTLSYVNQAFLSSVNVSIPQNYLPGGGGGGTSYTGGPTSAMPVAPTLYQHYWNTDLGFDIVCLQLTPTVVWAATSGSIVIGTGYTPVTSPLGGPTGSRPTTPILYQHYWDTTYGFDTVCTQVLPQIWESTGGAIVP